MRTLGVCLCLGVALLLVAFSLQRPERPTGAAPAAQGPSTERAPAALQQRAVHERDDDDSGELDRVPGGHESSRLAAREAMGKAAGPSHPELFVQFVDAWDEPLPFLEVRFAQAADLETLAHTPGGAKRIANADGRLQVSGGEGLWGTVLGLDPEVEGLEQREVLDLTHDEFAGGSRSVSLDVGFWRVELLDDGNRPAGGRGAWTLEPESQGPPIDARGYFGRGASGGSGASRTTIGALPGTPRRWRSVRAGQLIAVARRLGGRRVWASLEGQRNIVVSAPRSGQRAEPGVLQLPILSPGVLLHGRLAPEFAGAELTVVDLVGKGPDASQSFVPVDSSGAFVISTGVPSLGTLEVLHLAGRRALDGRAFGGTLRLDPPLRVPGVRGLGLVQVELLPLLLAGSMEIEEAGLSIEVWDNPPMQQPISPVRLMLGVNTLGLDADPSRVSFRDMSQALALGVSARSRKGSTQPMVIDPVDESGRFRVWGKWPHETAWLIVGGEPWGEFDVGERDLIVEAER